MRLGFLTVFDCGRASGHFINDVGATDEEAAAWIVRYQRRTLPDDATLIEVTLYRDHVPVYTRRPAQQEQHP